MSVAKRAPLLIGLAVLLPLVIFAGLELAFSAREQRDLVQSQALATTERILVRADARLARSLGALDVLGTARPFIENDWPAAYERAEEIARLMPDWVTVSLLDLETGAELFDLRRPFGSSPAGGSLLRVRPALGSDDAFVEGVGGGGENCPCVLIHRVIPRDGNPAFLLTVALDAAPFHAILMSELEEGRVAGIVDPRGNFIARSLENQARVGRPATRFVRDAIAKGDRGIYKGTTYEGFVNYSAFTTSRLSGWSAHLAFNPNLIDAPRWQSLAAAAFAAFASILLALVLIWYTLRQMAERRRVDERLQEAQKMEALGQLTGGIAHDFNNLLTPIVGGLDLLSRKEDLEPASRRMAQRALDSARKAVKLTAQLLAFSRRQQLEIRPVDLQELFAGLQPLLEQSVPSAITIRYDPLDEEARCVRSDPNQLELALLNLVVNARDAMPEGGEIRIGAAVAPEPPGGRKMIAIMVSDTGDGMPEEVKRRALEPFYTTKAPGSGTGLGLAQVYGIVQQSGGTMNIDSAPGRGTRVTLLLEAAEMPEPGAGRSAQPGPSTSASHHRIVICDDDDDVRGFVSRALDDAGFVVEAVSDGRTALEALRHAAASLLIVDFAMQEMNGAQVIRAVREEHGRMPVLLITGYADTDGLAETLSDVPILRKPFDAEALLVAVRNAIDGGPQGG